MSEKMDHNEFFKKYGFPHKEDADLVQLPGEPAPPDDHMHWERQPASPGAINPQPNAGPDGFDTPQGPQG